MTVNILGSGAIGGLCAAGAQLSATPYRLWPRPGSTALNNVELLNGESVSLGPPDCADDALTANDLLIVPLKVTQLKEALKTWRHVNLGNNAARKLAAQPSWSCLAKRGQISQELATCL